MKNRDYKPLDELMVAVHLNLAQVLLNVARHDEAFAQCQKALSMTCLMDKSALRKKVIHRFKSSKEPPSIEARLAAEEAAQRARELPHIPVPENLLVKYRYAFGDDIQDSEREAVEYCYQLARGGDGILASTIFRLATGFSEPEIRHPIQSTTQSSAAYN
jgi:hypothetical protein